MTIEKALKALDLPPFIKKDDIKKRYRELARVYHPDICSETSKMEEINSAYNLLLTYIDNFRYSFDSEEINKQFPNIIHNEKFKL